MTPLRPVWPAGLPSPEALQMATEALGQHYVLAETLQEPVVVAEAIQLAYLLSAYGLVPTQPRSVACAAGMADDDDQQLVSHQRKFDRPRYRRPSWPTCWSTTASAMELARA